MAARQGLRLDCKSLPGLEGDPAGGILQCLWPVTGLQIKRRHHPHHARIVRRQLKRALVVLARFCRSVRLGIGLTPLRNAFPVIHLGRQGIVGMTWSGLWLREMQTFRRDRRFEPFAARIGLTEYWNRFGGPDELS